MKPKTPGGRIGEVLRTCGFTVMYLAVGTMQLRKGQLNFAPKGTPDRLVVLPGGRVVWLETQTPADDLGPEHEAQHAKLRALGHTVVVTQDPLQALTAVQAVNAERTSEQ